MGERVDLSDFSDDELLRLAQSIEAPGAASALQAILQKPETQTGALESLLRVRTKLDANQLTPLLTESARQLLNQSGQARSGFPPQK